MLLTAVKAQLPIVYVNTRDTVTLQQTLCELLGVTVELLQKKGKIFVLPNSYSPGQVYYTQGTCSDWDKMYSDLTKRNCTVIIVNPEEIALCMFDGGWLSCPRSLLTAFVVKHTGAQPTDVMLAAFRGLCYLEVLEIAKLAECLYREFTPQAIQRTRQQYFPSVAGLQPINTKVDYYYPSKTVTDWLNVDGMIFLESDKEILIPRGMIFCGDSGCGKTSGAKYIASEMGVPLYRLNIPQLLSKWQGEADTNLSACLTQAEESAPCVLLIDEIEKVFVEDDSGTTPRLLSQLLWWLQEHDRKILTIMTTNDIRALPDELYRAGRIDAEIPFHKLAGEQVLTFIIGYVNTMKEVLHFTADEAEDIYQNLDDSVSHAEATNAVLNAAKKKEVRRLEAEQ